jgi:hypothetical protein
MRLEDVETITQSEDGVAYIMLDDPDGPPDIMHGVGSSLQTNNIPQRVLQTLPRERALSGTLKDANLFLNNLANDRANLQGMIVIMLPRI